MLRITKESTGRETILKLEGALRAEWLEELRGACAVEGEGSSLSIDLASVTYIDLPGRALLFELIGSGASISASSAFVAEFLHLRNS